MNLPSSTPTGQQQETPANNTTAHQPAQVLPKLGILEEDDEFEEFPIEDWDASGEMKLDVEQWEADWDDDNIDDEFSKQLRAELLKTSSTSSK